jgi:hypothetical protein
MNGIKCFVFFSTLDEIFSGVKRRFSHKTLSLITATRNLIQ